MVRITSVASVVLMLLFGAGVAAEESSKTAEPADADFDSSDWDRDDGDFSSLLKTAMSRYTDEAPDSRRAKRLAIDALMLATVSGDATASTRIKGELLQRYPSSVEAAYVLATFADGKTLREFLDAQFFKDITDVTRAKLAVRIARSAMPKFQKALLEDQGFALRLARAAFLADDRVLSNESQRVLKLNPAQVAAVACDELTPAEERFRELQSLSMKDDFQGLLIDIRGFQQHLLTLMKLEERSSPAIRQILARNYLTANELDQALVQFEYLKKQTTDPAVQFQHGYCLARLRRTDEARALLTPLSENDSPWQASAEAVLQGMENLDAIIDQHAELLMQVVGAYREREVDVCDMELCWSSPGGNSVTITLGVDTVKNRVEIVATRNEVPVFGFIGESSQSTVYIKGEPAILRLPKMPFLPDVKVSDYRFEKSGFHGNTQFTTGNSLSGLRKTVSDLISNDQLISPTTFKFMMAQLVRSGIFPKPIEHLNGTTRIQLISMDIDQPRLINSNISIDANHHFESANFDLQKQQFEIRRLILSKWQDHQLPPGNWPRLPTRVLPENEFGTLMRLVGSAIQLFAEENKPVESTAAADSTETSNR